MVGQVGAGSTVDQVIQNQKDIDRVEEAFPDLSAEEVQRIIDMGNDPDYTGPDLEDVSVYESESETEDESQVDNSVDLETIETPHIELIKKDDDKPNFKKMSLSDLKTYAEERNLIEKGKKITKKNLKQKYLMTYKKF